MASNQVNEISQGINSLKNRIDEALNRSASATLNSHRSLSSTLDAPQVEAIKTAPQINTEADLLASIQNYQVKSVYGVEPAYIPVQNHYHSLEQSYVPHYGVQQPVYYTQPTIIPYQYPVQEVRSATYGYEHPYAYSSTASQVYSPLEANRSFSLPVDYIQEHPYHKKNQNSAKKRPNLKNAQDIQNDEDSFSKDKKKTAQNPQDQKPKTQAAPAPAQNATPTQNPQTQKPQATQPQTQAAPAQNATPIQNPQAEKPQTTQPQTQAQPQGQNAQPQNPQTQSAHGQNPQPQTQAQKGQNPQGQSAPAQNPQSQPGQQAKNPIDKNELVMLPKKPHLINTLNFGQEQRRGGSK